MKNQVLIELKSVLFFSIIILFFYPSGINGQCHFYAKHIPCKGISFVSITGDTALFLYENMYNNLRDTLSPATVWLRNQNSDEMQCVFKTTYCHLKDSIESIPEVIALRAKYHLTSKAQSIEDEQAVIKSATFQNTKSQHLQSKPSSGGKSTTWSVLFFLTADITVAMFNRVLFTEKKIGITINNCVTTDWSKPNKRRPPLNGETLEIDVFVHPGNAKKYVIVGFHRGKFTKLPYVPNEQHLYLINQ